MYIYSTCKIEIYYNTQRLVTKAKPHSTNIFKKLQNKTQNNPIGSKTTRTSINEDNSYPHVAINLFKHYF